MKRRAGKLGKVEDVWESVVVHAYVDEVVGVYSVA